MLFFICRMILFLEILIREGDDFMKGTTFSEIFSKPSIVPYNEMEMGPSSDMNLSSSYEK
jgi:hypothetical protein